ncbi:hypothetical protein ACFSKU_00585 [Pontibacter silvestris]|uniref:Carbohydrate-binding protein n=1 Tax=Pontibacter silvestris TaxID=2305183 RepID=A0ABW4WRG3_9BACT|nr:hypothetical protein [Pontibacter silvestris]MCC9138139.1 hypothetical protein [Pontibacter silvestris]
MRKKIIDKELKEAPAGQQSWLDLEHLAQIEFTSEAKAHPIESALVSNNGAGWIAAQPGEQTIRIVFDEPHQIRRIQLVFHEKEVERTQEFLLRWLPAGDQSYQKIVRQQYTFSPPHTVEELEEYAVKINAVSIIELIIVPDVSGREVYASLTQFRLSS